MPKFRALSMAVICLFSFYISNTSSFSAWFVKDYCDRALAEGEIIMNEPIVKSDERKLLFYRKDKTPISDGDTVDLGEMLTCSISITKDQYVFEISSNKLAKFFGGGCDGKRISSYDATVIITKVPPESTENELKLWAGWAKGYGQVFITDSITLKISDKLFVNSSEDAEEDETDYDDEEEYEEYESGEEEMEAEETEYPWNVGIKEPGAQGSMKVTNAEEKKTLRGRSIIPHNSYSRGLLSEVLYLRLTPSSVVFIVVLAIGIGIVVGLMNARFRIFKIIMNYFSKGKADM